MVPRFHDSSLKFARLPVSESAVESHRWGKASVKASGEARVKPSREATAEACHGSRDPARNNRRHWHRPGLRNEGRRRRQRSRGSEPRRCRNGSPGQIVESGRRPDDYRRGLDDAIVAKLLRFLLLPVVLGRANRRIEAVGAQLVITDGGLLFLRARSAGRRSVHCRSVIWLVGGW